jgi:predicted MFS family arabinose efflux permease
MLWWIMLYASGRLEGAACPAAVWVFGLIGTTMSGLLADRYNPRILLFRGDGLRGLSLVVLRFTNFSVVSPLVFAVFYGLDRVATVPPTVMLSNEVFGRKDAPVIVSWIASATRWAVHWRHSTVVRCAMRPGVICLRPLPAVRRA